MFEWDIEKKDQSEKGVGVIQIGGGLGGRQNTGENGRHLEQRFRGMD